MGGKVVALLGWEIFLAAALTHRSQSRSRENVEARSLTPPYLNSPEKKPFILPSTPLCSGGSAIISTGA
jgi:hypothetical protein